MPYPLLQAVITKREKEGSKKMEKTLTGVITKITCSFCLESQKLKWLKVLYSKLPQFFG